jgi:hypothetical protein
MRPNRFRFRRNDLWWGLVELDASRKLDNRCTHHYGPEQVAQKGDVGEGKELSNRSVMLVAAASTRECEP